MKKSGLRPERQIGASMKKASDEIDKLLLAISRLLKDANLAKLALENPDQVLGGSRAAHTAIRLSILETQLALVPFFRRLDEARGE